MVHVRVGAIAHTNTMDRKSLRERGDRKAEAEGTSVHLQLTLPGELQEALHLLARKIPCRAGPISMANVQKESLVHIGILHVADTG